MDSNDSQRTSGAIGVTGARKRAVVLHVLPQDLNRGAQVYAGRLRDALKGDNSQEHLVVTLFQGDGGGARPDIALDATSGIGRKILDPHAWLRLRRLVKQLDVSVVVAHGGEALKYVIAAVAGRPTIYYKVGLSTAEVQRPVHRRLYRFLSRRTACVVGNSRAILTQVGMLFDVPTSRQALIPNGRDPQVYYPLSASGCPADPPRVLFVGQLERGKRPALFLKVVELLRRAEHRFDAAVAGDGPLKATLERQASHLKVLFLGSRTDIPELIRESAVVVLTSDPETEGMPGVLIEAGMSGIPAVATEAAGVADVIDHGRTGWVIEGGSAVQLAERVGELLENPDMRRAFGEHARIRCCAKFSMEAVSREWRSLISEVIGQESVRVPRSEQVAKA